MDMTLDSGRLLSCTTELGSPVGQQGSEDAHAWHTYKQISNGRIVPGDKGPHIMLVDDKTVNGSRSESRSLHIHQFSTFR